jgi:hypothetical protein
MPLDESQNALFQSSLGITRQLFGTIEISKENNAAHLLIYKGKTDTMARFPRSNALSFDTRRTHSRF